MTDTNPNLTATPGSFQFNNFKLITQIGQQIDLSKLFLELNVFEDIMNPTVSGNVIIADAIGLYNNAPITAEESLSLSFNSKEDDETQKVKFQRDFDIYKVSNKTKLKQDLDVYTLYFASPEFEQNMHTKVSKAYNKSADQIVKLLLTEDYPNGLGFKETSYRKLVAEASLYDENLVIPNWSPFEAIKYILRRTLPTANYKAANYVFFENRDGFNFVTIESLLKQTPKWTYFRDVRQASARKKTSFAIEDMKVSETQNVLDNINGGMYAGTLLTHDIVKKKYSKFEFDYLEEFDDTEHTNANPLLSQKSKRNEKPLGYIKFYPTHTDLYDGMPEGTNRVDKWLLKNSSLLQQMGSVKIIITVKGNSRVQVGDLVNLDARMRNPENDQNVVADKYYAGKYLVTAIRHHITPDEYNQTIELVGESYRASLANASAPDRPTRNA